MTVRNVSVAPGQLLNEGDRVADLLEPSGRWVSLVATEVAGQVKAVRVRVGDQITEPVELCAVYVSRRPKADEDPPTGSVKRMSLEELQLAELDAPAVSLRTPVRPLSAPLRHNTLKKPEVNAADEGIFTVLIRHKLLVAACVGLLLVIGGVVTGASMYDQIIKQPQMSMDELWTEMRAARIAAAEAENAKATDNISARAAAQNRALAKARDATIKSGACAGFFIGMKLPGMHLTRGVRRVTYLDPKRGVGAFVWSKTLVPDTFSCADER